MSKIDPSKTQKISKTSDLQRSIIIFYDKNNQELFRSRFETMGMYINSYQLWIWAWSIPRLEKNQIFLSRKLLNYSFDLVGKNINNNLFIKSEFSTSRFKITDFLQLDIHIAMAAYFAKKPFIYPQKNSLNENNFYISYLYLLDVVDENIDTIYESIKKGETYTMKIDA